MRKSGLQFLTPEAINAMGRLPLMARNVVEGFLTGLHASPFHGYSAEFSEHRKYTPGDPLKDIDWTAFARTDRYFVKRYREETNLRCRLLVDASASMDFTSHTVRKLEYTCCLSACIAYLALKQRDAVGLTLIAENRTDDIPESATSSTLGRICNQLQKLRGGGAPPLAGRLHETAEQLRRRGLIVVMSDLLDSEPDLFSALKHLRHRKHEVILFHILDPAEESLPYTRVTEFIDLENGGRRMVDPQSLRDRYVTEIQAFRNRYRRLCSDCGIDYMEVITDEPFESLFMRYLVRRARM